MTDPTSAVADSTASRPSSLAVAKPLAPADPRVRQLRRLRKAAGDFESLFLAQLLQSMQRTVGSTPGGSSYGSEIMLGVAQEKMAEAMAEKGGLGLGKMLYESLQDRMVPDSASPASPERGTRTEPVPLKSQTPDPIPLAPENQPRPLAPARSTLPDEHPIERIRR